MGGLVAATEATVARKAVTPHEPTPAAAVRPPAVPFLLQREMTSGFRRPSGREERAKIPPLAREVPRLHAPRAAR